MHRVDEFNKEQTHMLLTLFNIRKVPSACLKFMQQYEGDSSEEYCLYSVVLSQFHVGYTERKRIDE